MKRKNGNRTSKSIKNSTIAFLGQILILLFQFTTQTFFVHTLGAEYVGANGLFTNLLTLLSFADLGIGGAITYALYQPLAEKNEKIISAIMHLFKLTYHIIGLSILVLGFLFSFFISFFVNKNSYIPHLQIMFILFVTNSSASYFFAYLRSLLIANQEAYVDTLNRVIFTFFQMLVQVVFLLLTHLYVVFLIIQIFFTVSANISLQRKTLARFSFIKYEKAVKIPSHILQGIKKNILGAIASRFGIIVTNGTDNLILSKFIGLATVGKYTSYLLILNSAQNILTQVFNSIVASLANFSVEKGNENEDRIFFLFQYLVFGIANTFAITMYFILQPFIVFWIGKEYLLANLTVILLILVWYTNITKLSVQSFITAHGLYWETKWKSVAEACLNLIVSLILIMTTHLGVNSVIIGTLSANLLIDVWWEPMLLFKFGFGVDKWKYIYRYLKYVIMFLFSLSIAHLMLTKVLVVSNIRIINILLNALICFIGSSFFYLLMNLFFYEQKYFMNLVKKKLKIKKRTN
jgi:O-antigen/teichoic acid export membrane protein